MDDIKKGAKDKALYNEVFEEIKQLYPKHSAYRSGLLVKRYKDAYSQKYGRPASEAYWPATKINSPLARWFAEDWKNQRGEVGYNVKGDIYRPSRRINELTPTTWSELTTQEIKAAKKEKSKTGRVRRFKK